MSKTVGLAFKATVLLLLAGILGITIGILIVSLNVRDDVEATPAAPTTGATSTIVYKSTTAPKPTSAEPLQPCSSVAPDVKTTTVKTTTTKLPGSSTTAAAAKTTTGPVKTTTAEVKTTTAEVKTTTAEVKTTTAEVKTTTAEVKTTTAQSKPDDDGKNIPTGPIIGETDPRFASFKGISDLFESWIDVTVDPCNDFYHYTCGKGQKNNVQSPFEISQLKDNQVDVLMWEADEDYWKNAPLPIKQARWIRDKCYQDTSFTADDTLAKQKILMEEFIGVTGVNVPFLYPGQPTEFDEIGLAQFLGLGIGKAGAYALLTTYVSVDLQDPDNSPYRFYVDQPLPLMSAGAYEDDKYKALVVRSFQENMKEFAKTLGVELDNPDLKTMAEDLYNFDKAISTTMQQDATVRRDAARNYNPYPVTDLQKNFTSIQWVPYLQSVATVLGNKFTATDELTVIIMEEDITLNLVDDLIKNAKKETIANYVYMMAFSSIEQDVPSPPSLRKKESILDQYRPVLNRDRRTIRKPEKKKEDETRLRGKSTCQSIVENILPWAATRMYVDTDIPDKKNRQQLKENVREIANWIFFGFRSQLDQLNWMDSESKKGAFSKLDNLQLNIAYPDWVEDDQKLADFYKTLTVAEDDNFMTMYEKILDYFHLKEMTPLLEKPTRDRGDFQSFIGITNAWYAPQMNSITFPEGILQEPFYSPDYPLATIFGGLGSISGHELTHGFDDQGVQWDGVGALKAWMTADSQTAFNAMAKCVIDEYSSFCPFRPDHCVNGENTQGENIADNGGIQAAYKALKAYESLNGADPRLPGFGSTFTSDQLFFLTFAQTWCDVDQGEGSFELQVKTDVHSPALYRVLGTIQNFPAFRNAFNCPVGTPYTPKDHCNVWTSKPF